MIAEDYVSFETTKLLKEKGFESDCCHTAYDCNGEFCWCGDYSKDRKGIMDAPTLQMVMKWLRTIHNIDIEISAEVGILGTRVYVPMISTYRNRKNAPEKLTQLKFGLYYKNDKGGVPALKYYKTNEEACEEGIKYCLENLI